MLTLPAGRTVRLLDEGLGAGSAYDSPVARLVVGEGLYYARRGLIKREEQALRLSSDPEGYGLRSALSSQPVKVSLTWTSERPLPDAEWVVRALPLREGPVGDALGAVSGPVAGSARLKVKKGGSALSLGLLTPGLYLLTAARVDAPASVAAAGVLRVTDLNLVAISAPNQTRVWVTRLGSGAPLQGAEVRGVALKRNEEGRLVARRALGPVRTDAQGLAALSLRDGEYAVLQTQTQLGGQVHRADLGQDYALWSGDAERARALIQTDKPVYRPGETLRGFALLRRLGAGTRTPYTGEVTVRLVRGYPRLALGQVRVKPDADGLIRYSFPLPEDARTGSYALEVVLPGSPSAANPQPQPDVSSLPVEVRAFVKPQFTLDLSAPEEIVSGAPAVLTARAELYAGGGANVQAEVFTDTAGGGNSEPYLWVQDGDEGVNYQYETVSGRSSGGGWSPSIGPKRRPDAALQTRAGQGRVSLDLRAKGGQPTPYAVTVRARDEYGRDVQATRQITVHPAALKFELLTQPRQTGARSEVRAAVRVVGSNEPRSGATVRAELVRVRWVKNKRIDETVSTQTVKSGPGGALTLQLPLPSDKPGGYLLRLSTTDSAGRVARATVDAGTVNEPSERPEAERLTLSADKAVYAPGDTAKVELRTSLPKGTPLLLVASAENRTLTRLITVSGPQQRVEWKITRELEPAFQLQAVAVRGGRTVLGMVGGLLVPRLDQRLGVSVQAQGEVRPGENATFTVRTTRAGQPVSALVTLSGVNEAVYAITEDPTPNPWRWLWGATWPQSELRSSSDLSDGGRGGGGGDLESGLYRQDLRDVAVFQAVQTDKNGRAQVTVKMPEALGPYRLMARAFTRSGGVGEAQGEQRVGLPFAVRLARPRVLTLGDTGTAAVSAERRGGQGGQVTLSLKAGGEAASRTLPLQGGSATSLFPLKAPGSGSVLTLEASATLGTQRDGVRESLPLRPAGTRELLSSGGVLRAAGSATDRLSWEQDQAVESLILDLAATPLQLALSGLDPALADPKERWITTDAVSARLSTNLDLAGLAGAFGWTELRTRALAQARRDLVTLLGLHSNQGGWGWSAEAKPDPEMTARALSALVQARGAALTDAGTVEAARTEAQALYQKGSKLPLLAAALARAGAPQAAVNLARAGVGDPAEAARLAEVLAGTQPELARRLYAQARQAAKTDKDGALVLTPSAFWRGDTEPTALLLQAAARLGQQADFAPLRAALEDRRTGSAWDGPVATAEAVRALRQLAEKEGKPAPREVTVTLGSYRQVLTVTAPTRLLIPAGSVTPGALTLQSSAPLAYARELRVRRSGAAPAALSPVKVTRQYDKASVARDGVVTVTLTVTSPSAARHLRVVDPLPGGLEAVDDRPFTPSIDVNPAGSNQTVWTERSLYDDRAVFYLEDLKAGTTTLRYRLRALASGTYAAPAPRVEFASGAAPAQGSAQKITVK